MKMKVSLFFALLLVGDWCAGQSNTIKSGIYSLKAPRTSHEQVLNGTTTFLKPLVVSVETIKPGQQRIPNKNLTTFEELLIVKEGQLTIQGKDGKPLGPGSIVFLTPNDKRGLKNEGATDVIYYRLEYNAISGVDEARGKSNGGSFIIDWDDLLFKPTEVGGRRDYFSRPTATTTRFEMHVTTLNEGVPSHAPHKHDEEEIILLMKGNATMTVEGQEYLMGPGDFVFAASHDFHGIRNTGKGQCEYFAFQWK
jgi:(S)-ureidoglycine aminohydrolase